MKVPGENKMVRSVVRDFLSSAAAGHAPVRVAAPQEAEGLPPEDPETEAIAAVDMAADRIVQSLMILEEQLPKVQTDGIVEEKAVKAMVDLLETGITPYMHDFLKELEKFEED